MSISHLITLHFDKFLTCPVAEMIFLLEFEFGHQKKNLTPYTSNFPLRPSQIVTHDQDVVTKAERPEDVSKSPFSLSQVSNRCHPTMTVATI